MNVIRAILKKNPTIFSIFVITPDETIAHCHPHKALLSQYPTNHLNRFYHDATQLIPGGHELTLAFETTWITLRPLPKNWILAIHHDQKCPQTAIDALQRAATRMTTGVPQRDLLSILTPNALIKGELAPWIRPLIKLRTEITGAPCQNLCHQIMNRWINREDPCQGSLDQLSSMLAATIHDPVMRGHYTEKAKKILTTVPRKKRGEKLA